MEEDSILGGGFLDRSPSGSGAPVACSWLLPHSPRPAPPLDLAFTATRGVIQIPAPPDRGLCSGE